MRIRLNYLTPVLAAGAGLDPSQLLPRFMN
jgi:hypothetical protein